jgi:transaldolase/glucose-6-phosphate isomerase
VLYVEELIGKNTVNTLPPKTLQAFQDHGSVKLSLVANIEAAEKTIKAFDECGISLNEITEQLLVEGVKSFSASFDKLLSTLGKGHMPLLDKNMNSQSISIPKVMAAQAERIHTDWNSKNCTQRLWERDSSLWTNRDESKWLGWLTVVQEQIKRLPIIDEFSADVRSLNFTDVLLLGMGGSSLCAEVMSKTFAPAEGFPRLHILDSTDPDQIEEIESKINISKTLFIVSSKSGSTLEPNIFCKYFYEKLKKELRELTEIGGRFIVITDIGSPLEKLALEKKFKNVFHGKPDVGGRYSALSDFGMIPSALLGIDMRQLLLRTALMVNSCQQHVLSDENPAARLGLLLGTCGLAGRNKITFFCSEQIKNLGTWLEQLLAESTGKEGKGFIPITGEDITEPRYYGNDRIFVYLKVASDESKKFEENLLKLQEAGHPVVTITMADKYGLGQEFFRWEMATAIAGSVLKINPFNQPDVEASKEATRELTDNYEKTGQLKEEKPIYEEDGIQVFGNHLLSPALGKQSRLAEIIGTSLGEMNAGDYFGLLAYLPMDSRLKSKMQDMRLAIRDSKKVATCLEFGPRFLHSTGQVYKGGPNTGVFLEVTADHKTDLSIPGHRATFGIIEMAQAKGDFQVLTVQKKRRGLRVHLRKDVQNNLAKLSKAFHEALHVGDKL